MTLSSDPETPHVIDLIEAFLAGGLTAAERAAFQVHVAACRACSALLEEARRADAALSLLFAAGRPDADFEEALVGRLRDASPKGMSQARRRRLRSITAATAYVRRGVAAGGSMVDPAVWRFARGLAAIVLLGAIGMVGSVALNSSILTHAGRPSALLDELGTRLQLGYLAPDRATNNPRQIGLGILMSSNEEARDGKERPESYGVRAGPPTRVEPTGVKNSVTVPDGGTLLLGGQALESTNRGDGGRLASPSELARGSIALIRQPHGSAAPTESDGRAAFKEAMQDSAPDRGRPGGGTSLAGGRTLHSEAEVEQRGESLGRGVRSKGVEGQQGSRATPYGRPGAGVGGGGAAGGGGGGWGEGGKKELSDGSMKAPQELKGEAPVVSGGSGGAAPPPPAEQPPVPGALTKADDIGLKNAYGYSVNGVAAPTNATGTTSFGGGTLSIEGVSTLKGNVVASNAQTTPLGVERSAAAVLGTSAGSSHGATGGLAAANNDGVTIDLNGASAYYKTVVGNGEARDQAERLSESAAGSESRRKPGLIALAKPDLVDGDQIKLKMEVAAAGDGAKDRPAAPLAQTDSAAPLAGPAAQAAPEAKPEAAAPAESKLPALREASPSNEPPKPGQSSPDPALQPGPGATPPPAGTPPADAAAGREKPSALAPVPQDSPPGPATPKAAEFADALVFTSPRPREATARPASAARWRTRRPHPASSRLHRLAFRRPPAFPRSARRPRRRTGPSSGWPSGRSSATAI